MENENPFLKFHKTPVNQGENPFLQFHKGTQPQQTQPPVQAQPEAEKARTQFDYSDWDPRSISIGFDAKKFTDMATAVPKGISNAVGNVIETGLAAKDWLTAPAEGVPESPISPRRVLRSATPTAEKFRDDWVFFDKDPEAGWLPNFIQEGTEFGMGAAGGGALASKILPKVSGSLPKVAGVMASIGRYLGIGAGADVGSALTANRDTKPLLTGPDAAFHVIKGFGTDKKGTYNEELFNDRANLMLDSLVTGLGIGGAIGGIAEGSKLLGRVLIAPMILRFSPEAQQLDVATQLMQRIADIDPSDSAAVREGKIREVIAYIRENSEQILKLNDIDPRLTDESFVLDTISTMMRDINPNTTAGNINSTKLQEMRAALSKGQYRNFLAAQDNPQMAVGNTLDQVSKLSTEPLESTQGKIIGSTVDERVTPLREELTSLEARKQTIAQEVTDEINNNPLFRDVLKRVGVNINTAKGKKTIATDITQNLIAIGDSIRKKKNELFAAIPDGTKGNMAPVNKRIQEIEAMFPEGLGSQWTAIKKRIEAANGDVKKLHDIGSVNVSDLITSFSKVDGRVAAAREISSLKKALTSSQLDYLVEKTAKNKGGKQKATAEAIKRARDFYQNEMAPWRDNPVLSDILNISKNPDVGDVAVMPKARGTVVKAFDDLARPGSPTETVIGDELGRDVVSVYTRNYADAPMKVRQYAYHEIMTNILDDLNINGVLTPEQIVKYEKSFKQIAPLLDPDETRRIEGFLTSIRNKGVIEPAELDEAIKAVSTQIKDSEQEIAGEFLKEFFQNKNIKTPSSNAWVSFRNLFSKEGNEGRIREIMDMISQDPIALDSVRSAFTKSLKNDLFTAGAEAGGVRTVNLKKMAEFLNEDSSLYRYTEEVLGEDFAKVLRAGVDMAYDINSRSAGRQTQIMDPKQVDVKAYTAFNSILTIVYGVLNPTAARIRAVTTRINKEFGTEDEIIGIIDMMASNPKLFADISERILDGTASMEYMQRVLPKALEKTIVYGEKEEEPSAVEKQMNKMLGVQ